MKSDSEAFRDSLWDRMKAYQTSSHNFFVEEADYDLSAFTDEANAKPAFKFDEVKQPEAAVIHKASEDKQTEKDGLCKQDIASDIKENQKEIEEKEVSNVSDSIQ